MSKRTEIAELYVAAQRSRDPKAIQALGGSLAEQVVLITRRGNVEGREAVLQRLANPAQGNARARFAMRLLRLTRWRRRATSQAPRDQVGGAGAMLGQLQFGPPAEDAGTVTLKADLPPNPMFSKVTVKFDFNGADELVRIEQRLD